MRAYFKNIYDGVISLFVGMRASLRHMKNKEELVATMQYPHETWPIPDRNIGFKEDEYNLIRSRLHVDIDDCIGCLQCERACPVDCIKIDNVKPPKGSEYDCGITSNDTQKKMVVARFTIDMAECCYCNLCAYPCPEECIYMVGGPNSHKHEMDYEFGKYKRDGLLYEFSDATDEEIIAAGGEAYLNKRENRSNELENALELVAMAAEKAQEEVDTTQDKSEDEVSKPSEPRYNFDAINKIENKPARGLAKRAFIKGIRNKLDASSIAELVKTDLKKTGKYSSEYDDYIEEIKNSKLVTLPESAINKDDQQLNSESKEVINEPGNKEETIAFETSPDATIISEGLIPDIKVLNDIEDKMARGITKKAFMAAKKQKLAPKGYADGIKAALIDADKWNDSFEIIINKISQFGASVESSAAKPEISSSAEVVLEEVVLDIKVLNAIEDKMARGIAKKAFMGAKRQKIPAENYMSHVEDALKESGKLTDEIKLITMKLGI